MDKPVMTSDELFTTGYLLGIESTHSAISDIVNKCKASAAADDEPELWELATKILTILSAKLDDAMVELKGQNVDAAFFMQIMGEMIDE